MFQIIASPPENEELEVLVGFDTLEEVDATLLTESGVEYICSTDLLRALVPLATAPEAEDALMGIFPLPVKLLMTGELVSNIIRA